MKTLTYGDHIVVDGGDEDGELRGWARMLLIRQASETIDLLENVVGVSSFRLLEKQCDLLGFFWEDDLAACPSAGEHGDQPHWHMGWKAEVVHSS